MSIQWKHSSNNISIRRFGDCALVEIIHLHDCLRGAIGDLQKDVTELSQEFASASSSISSSSGNYFENSLTCNNINNRKRVEDLERRVASRFQVIWSVFKAHSAAEDEFIWPALRQKMHANEKNEKRDGEDVQSQNKEQAVQVQNYSSNKNIAAPNEHNVQSSFQSNDLSRANFVPLNPEEISSPNQSDPATIINSTQKNNHVQTQEHQALSSLQPQGRIIEQEEYEEDHADEERMFMEMDSLLSKLREGLYNRKKPNSSICRITSSSSSDNGLQENTLKNTASFQNSAISNRSNSLMCTNQSSQQHMKFQQQPQEEVLKISQTLKDRTTMLTRHLLQHLEKEEVHCIPLVKQHLTHDEINDLVGRIMGQRSSDVMIQILNLAVHNLPEEDRDEMVRYMKQAMVGTFFERWLTMGGWTGGEPNKDGEASDKNYSTKSEGAQNNNSTVPRYLSLSSAGTIDSNIAKGAETTKNFRNKQKQDSKREEQDSSSCSYCQDTGCCLNPEIPCCCSSSSPSSPCVVDTTQEELEKLIRAIASNPELTPKQKNTTIQGLRDSVWKCRKRKLSESGDGGKRKKHSTESSIRSPASALGVERQVLQKTTSTRGQRTTPPSRYYKKNHNAQVELVWSSSSPTSFPSADKSVPLFSASELAPTFHDGATGAVLGCPHYARSCKLRHPSSGRLYTCRLCCEQEREMPMRDKDSPLDRYAVTEILCMRCNTLQPSDNESCINPECDSGDKPFAKYHCKICNFYDDIPHKSIYHCPFCNVCRSGKGLGIDYRHCMRCNACVSLTEDNHVCIPQRLQGNCPICHETMFESTEPLRGLKCGHVMHLSCFSMYMRGQAYTCPLCKKSVEDMKEYFALLDSAVRMQPMPAAYAATHSSIYCQDCGKVSKVQYHFVGCKCAYCGSYNTREIERSEDEASRDQR